MSAMTGDEGKAIALQQMQDTLSSTSLFRLPPELRLIIWKLLLPGRRVLKVRSSGASLDPRRGDDRRFVFGFDSKASQPILSQICAESRQCLLDYGNGQFIFGLEGEAGLWWGPEDVLLFDRDWCLRWATPSLQGLRGLDSVKNIALDATQAQYIYYEYVLSEDDEANQDDSDDGDEENYNEEDDGEGEQTYPASQALQPQSITLGYMSSTDNPHFLEYFTALDKLMMVFDRAIWGGPDFKWYTSAAATSNAPISQFLDSSSAYRYATFCRDTASIDDAVREVSDLRCLWIQTKALQFRSYRFYDDRFEDDHVLYNYCVDGTRTGPTHEPTRVSWDDMMHDEAWTL